MTSFDHRHLDDLVHSRIRLPVLAVLATAGSADFTELRDAVNTTDGNLGMHLRKLEEAGYVDVEKGFHNRKPFTRYTLSAKGRTALREYAARMEELLAGAKLL